MAAALNKSDGSRYLGDLPSMLSGRFESIVYVSSETVTYCKGFFTCADEACDILANISCQHRAQQLEQDVG